MPLDLRALVAPEHTALVLQEVQDGGVGAPSALCAKDTLPWWASTTDLTIASPMPLVRRPFIVISCAIRAVIAFSAASR